MPQKTPRRKRKQQARRIERRRRDLIVAAGRHAVKRGVLPLAFESRGLWRVFGDEERAYRLVTKKKFMQEPDDSLKCWDDKGGQYVYLAELTEDEAAELRRIWCESNAAYGSSQSGHWENWTGTYTDVPREALIEAMVKARRMTIKEVEDTIPF